MPYCSVSLFARHLHETTFVGSVVASSNVVVVVVAASYLPGCLRAGYSVRLLRCRRLFVANRLTYSYGCARHLRETLNRLRACCDCSIRDVV